MNLSPLPIQKFFDNNGRPLAGGLLFTYEAGTSTKIATYTDSGGGTPNTNPVVLDFRGECRLWIDPLKSYKYVLAPRGDTDPPTNPIWTVDNITATPLAFDNAAVDTGPANSIELSIPQITSPVAFTRVMFLANNTNTGPVTLQINGGTAADVTWQNRAAFAGGEIQADGEYQAIYDGAQWQLQGPTLNPTQMQTAEESAALVTPVNYAYQPGDVRRYGALMDGVTDDTTAFQTAWKLKQPFAPAGTTVITGSIPIIGNQQGWCDGTVILITGTSVKVFTVADGIFHWSMLGKFRVLGDNNSSGSVSGLACAIEIVDSGHWYIQAIEGEQIKGACVSILPGTNAVPRGQTGIIQAMQAYGCYIGLSAEAGLGSEYVQVVAPNINECNSGMIIAAGNLNVIGGGINDCGVDGVVLLSGANNCHGIFSGTQINHNAVPGGFGVRADGVTNGHTFDGCHIYENDIYLKDSVGIVFSDCVVDCNNYYFEGSSGSGFRDCSFPDAYGNVITNSFNASPSYTFWDRSRKLTGKNFGDALGGIVGLRVKTESPGLTYTPANLTAEQTVLLDLTSQHSPNDAAQTFYTAYDAGTGQYTCQAAGDGHTRVDAQFSVTNNAADNMANLYMYVRINGAGEERWLNRIILTTTKVVFECDSTFALDDGDTLEFRIGQTAGIANNVTLAASDTHVSVEGL